MKPSILSSSTLTGQNIYNLDDENIGSIKDLMIDLDNSKIAYAVISFGGFMGIGDKLFAMPLKTFQFSDHDDSIRLDISKEKLENAPSFDKDNWPKTNDSKFVDSVNRHYGIESERHAAV